MSSVIKTFDPPACLRSRIYSHVGTVDGPARLIYTAGQVGRDSLGQIPEKYEDQVKLAYENLGHCLAAANASSKDIIKLTYYIVDYNSHKRAHVKITQDFLGGHRPAITSVPVQQLAAPEFLFEVEAIAAVRDNNQVVIGNTLNPSCSPPQEVDVIVVGGGISGLQAAYSVQSAGLSSLVLEARNRVGGKLLALPVSQGGCVDLGGVWINDTNQPRAYALAQKLGLDLIEQATDGDCIIQQSNEYQSEVDKVRHVIEELCHSADNPQSTQYDKMNMKEFVQALGLGSAALENVALWTRAMLGCEPSEMSTLYFLNYCKLGGGLIQMRSDRKHGGQFLRARQGMGSLATGLVSLLKPGSVVLNSTVAKIIQDTFNKTTVITRDGIRHRCRKVIVSLPTPLYKEIAFEPQLPTEKLKYSSSTRLGYYAKIFLIYDEPWWKNHGLCGLTQSFVGPASLTRDSSCPADGQYSLTCFIVGDIGRKWSALSKSQRESQILEQVASIYGEELAAKAKKPVAVFEQDWAKEEFSQGCPCPVAPPGVLSRFGEALRAPFGNIQFVGTETARQWKGYIEGALESGERGADEVIRSIIADGPLYSPAKLAANVIGPSEAGRPCWRPTYYHLILSPLSNSLSGQTSQFLLNNCRCIFYRRILTIALIPACDNCYHRKVRCEYESNGPCLACDRAGVDCTFLLAERHKARRRARRRGPSSIRQNQRLASNRLPRRSTISGAGDATTESLDELVNDQPDRCLLQEPHTIQSDEESLGKTSLARFHQHSINTSSWRVFNDDANMRIAYIGTPVSNLSKLVKDEADFNGPYAPSLHLPFPSIRPLLPWKPPHDLPSARYLLPSFIDEIGSLPSQDLTDNLIDAFFTKVHPGFPIIDEAKFRNSCRDPQNPPPILLLQAVLLVGAHVSNHPKIAGSRSRLKMTIFRRAKTLFDLHYENDRMHLVQAALLFTWHFDGADDVSSNSYYWIGVACRIAFGLGMHRNLGRDSVSRMPVEDRRIYRRIWWTLIQLDVLIGIHHGRPLMISADDCDQPPLQADDFIESNSEINSNVNIDFCIQNTILCEILRSILTLSSPRAARDYNTDPSLFQARKSSIDLELSRWYLRLPVTFTELSGPDASFWSFQLQMHYNMALLHLHRLSAPALQFSNSPDLGSDNEICHAAALSILHIFETIAHAGQAAQCWPSCFTSLLATGIQLSYEARCASRIWACSLEIQIQNNLTRLIETASVVSQYWSCAEAVIHLYKDLLEQLKQETRSNFELMDPTSDRVSGPASSLDKQTRLPEASENPPRQDISRSFQELAPLFGAGQGYDITDIQWPELEGYSVGS